jgi:RNA polymerase primary sigma factor
MTSSSENCTFYRLALARYPVWTREEETEAGGRLIAARQALLAHDLSALPERVVAALKRAVRRVEEEYMIRNMRLVFVHANRYRHASGMTQDDLVQIGALGMLRAISKFEPARGFRFSTYASHWIRQQLTRGNEDEGHTIRRPAHLHETVRKIRRCSARVFAATGRDATLEELVEMTHQPAEVVERALESNMVAGTTSLDHSQLDDGDMYEVVAGAIAPTGPELVEARERVALSETLLGAIQGRDRGIVRQRFSDDETTLGELGERHDLSRERVRQIEVKAIGRMRHALAKV